MTTKRFLGIALTALVALVVAAPARAQSTKGGGKFSSSIIKWPVVNIQAKAAGTLSAKPAASVAGKPPTGGTLTTLKLAKDVSDPLKPGFAAGDYVLQIETGATPDGDTTVSAFVAFTVGADFKCTAKAADSVDGDGTGDLCSTTADPLCAPSLVGKCTFSTYQAAGIPNYTLGPGDGQPTAGRFRIRTANHSTCHTSDIILAGSPVPPGSTCGSGAVVGVVGVANGDVTP